MKVKLKRAQIRQGQQGIDTTVKSATGFAKAFAPTWDMVMGHKNGTLSDERYTFQYTTILDRILDPRRDRSLENPWRQLLAAGQGAGEVTLLCYCRDGRFCHTHLMIDYATTRWPEAFEDGR